MRRWFETFSSRLEPPKAEIVVQSPHTELEGTLSKAAAFLDLLYHLDKDRSEDRAV
jgi:hypothetical protein